MNKLFLPVVITAIIGMTLRAYAGDVPRTPVNLMPARTITAASPATGTPAAQEDQPKHETAELRDGTKIEISDDNTVTIINPDGTRNVAPDGILTLKDQTTFDVKDGKRVDY